MARRVTPSQLKSMIQQAQNRRKQAINKYNQAVNKHNQAVRKHNQDQKRAVDNHNREVRAHNVRVRAYRTKLQTEISKLQRQSKPVRYTTLRTTVTSVHQAYVQLEQRSGVENLGSSPEHLLDLAERETANSIGVMNVLEENEVESPEATVSDLRTTEITDQLSKFSIDLDSRWRGAVYALSPSNPDAARHFCTSTREIFATILDKRAPDKAVFKMMPDCKKTPRGNPTRREKVHYLLRLKGMASEALEDFVERNIEDIIELFDVLNKGTHGSAGRFELTKLFAIKKRAENGIEFLTSIVF